MMEQNLNNKNIPRSRLIIERIAMIRDSACSAPESLGKARAWTNGPLLKSMPAQ